MRRAKPAARRKGRDELDGIFMIILGAEDNGTSLNFTQEGGESCIKNVRQVSVCGGGGRKIWTLIVAYGRRAKKIKYFND